MAKIDLEKFICSMFKSFNETFGKDAVQFIPTYKGWTDALKDQGLEYKDGQIVEIIKEPLEIKAGHWYMCIRDLDDNYANSAFSKGRVYESTVDGTLIPGNSNVPHNVTAATDHYFRPATEDEIPHESKFKVGDWIVDKETEEKFQIVKVLEHTYEIIDFDGVDYHIPHYNVDADYNLFTIQDAKDGDVLCLYYNNRKSFCIFKTIIGEGDYADALVHCCYTGEYQYLEPSFNTECRMHNLSDGGYFVPADKDERDILSQKMAEAGYEWDAEKKELKEIESKHPADGLPLIKPREECTDCGSVSCGGCKYAASEEKLTEFEAELQKVIDDFVIDGMRPSEAQTKIYATSLITLARKQIAEEVDVNCMVNSFAKEKTSNEMMIFEVYRQGVLDTLEKIEEN